MYMDLLPLRPLLLLLPLLPLLLLLLLPKCKLLGRWALRCEGFGVNGLL